MTTEVHERDGSAKDARADPSVSIAAVDQMFEIGEWMRVRLHDLSLPTADVVLIPVLNYSLSLEHHRGIAFLLRAGIYAPAFALARPVAEAYVRGAWIRECATPEEIEGHKADTLRVSFGAMVHALEEKPGYQGGTLSQMHTSSRRVLNGFTHGGAVQTSRQISQEAIEPSATVGEVRELATFSSGIALLAFQGVVIAASRVDFAVEALDVMKSLRGDQEASA